MLRATATPQGFQLKGDVKIGGAPMSSRIPQGAQRAGCRSPSARHARRSRAHAISALKWARRSPALFRSGFPAGSRPASDREGRFNIEADLTSTQIDGLLPGWAKPSGKPARATFVLTTKPQSIRVEDLLIEGAGAGVKGTIDFDGSGDVQSASFPSYGFSDGDRASLKIERGSRRRAARDHARRSL